MKVTGNQAVSAACKLRRYVDKDGREWWMGADGWHFDDGDEAGLIRHTAMMAKIKAEHP